MREQDREGLRLSPLFADVEDIELLLEGCAEEQSVSRGERLPDDPPAIRVLMEGRAVVRTAGKGGAELRVLERGDVYGAAGLFGEPHTAVGAVPVPVSAVTAETDVRLLVLPRETFWKLLHQSDALLRGYLAFLSERIVFLNRRLTRYTAPDHTTRLAGYLYEQREQTEEGCAVRVPNLTRLASQLGQTRVTLYRAVDALTGAGLLRRNGDLFLLPDPDALRRYTLGQ